MLLPCPTTVPELQARLDLICLMEKENLQEFYGFLYFYSKKLSPPQISSIVYLSPSEEILTLLLKHPSTRKKKWVTPELLPEKV